MDGVERRLGDEDYDEGVTLLLGGHLVEHGPQGRLLDPALRGREGHTRYVWFWRLTVGIPITMETLVLGGGVGSVDPPVAGYPEDGAQRLGPARLGRVLGGGGHRVGKEAADRGEREIRGLRGWGTVRANWRRVSKPAIVLFSC
jgi:hypothetical protein